MLLDLLYSEDIDIKDLEKYFLASSQRQAPGFSPKNFITDPSDSGKINFVTSCSGVAPIASAASKMPFPVSRREFSNKRVKSGIAFTVRGTIAAVAPILVPIKNFVTGIIATRRTTNGVLLTILIITLMIL